MTHDPAVILIWRLHCADFGSQYEAQKFFVNKGGPEEVRITSTGMGMAMEWPVKRCIKLGHKECHKRQEIMPPSALVCGPS